MRSSRPGRSSGAPPRAGPARGRPRALVPAAGVRAGRPIPVRRGAPREGRATTLADDGSGQPPGSREVTMGQAGGAGTSSSAKTLPVPTGAEASMLQPASRFLVIPAWAGNTHDPARSRWLRSVHPRACGEHWRRSTRRLRMSGSSPRMRGTRASRESLPSPTRFIPAHAGNTCCRSAAMSASAVHPRACGEHHDVARRAAARAGSSPRMRGTHRGRHRLHAERRLSPRMRGTPELLLTVADAGRFIPAHAGNTTGAAGVPTIPSVHPRACGEHKLSPGP